MLSTLLYVCMFVVVVCISKDVYVLYPTQGWACKRVVKRFPSEMPESIYVDT